MYFGDWLRTGDIKAEWYISWSSPHSDYLERLSGALHRDCLVRSLSPTCILIESTASRNSVIKKIRKVLKPEDNTLLLYAHHKTIGCTPIAPEGMEINLPYNDEDEE